MANKYNLKPGIYVQHNPFKMLCLGSIGMDSGISKSCCKGTNVQRKYRLNYHFMVIFL